LTLTTPANKTILASRSFGRAVVERQELEESICTHVARAAEKLRRQNLVAGAVMVFVTTNKFKTEDRQYAASRTVELSVASADTMTLSNAALTAAKRLWRPGYRYKKAGITLLALGQSHNVQSDLWCQADTPKSKALMRVLDAINAEHGRDTLKLAASGIERAWGLRSGQRSPHYTTDWDDLLKVGG
jgi:DNA polymerase V